MKMFMLKKTPKRIKSLYYRILSNNSSKLILVLFNGDERKRNVSA